MLTDTKCRTSKAQDKPYKLTDGKGLYLEVKPNGIKAWRYRFKLTREGEIKESVFAIGELEEQSIIAPNYERPHRKNGIAALYQ